MKENHAEQTQTVQEKSSVKDDCHSKMLSPSRFFLKWDKVLVLGLSFEADENSIPTVKELDAIIKEFKADQEHLYTVLLEKFETSADNQDKQQFISVSQRLLIRLSNRLYFLSKSPNVSESLQQFYNALIQHLEQSLTFIEELFFNHFNADEYVPISLACKKRSELKSRQQKANAFSIKDEDINSDVVRLVFENVINFLSDDNTDVRYKDLTYHETLLEELSHLSKSPSNQQVREILYFLNYNHEAFLEYEFARLLELTANADNNKHKISLLKWEQKLINQYPAKMRVNYDDARPSLQDQLNKWINEEVKYLENDYHHPTLEGTKGGYNDKIHTSLSVAKLAVIIRLLVIDKIIINRTVAPMLRVVVKVFSTLQKDEISYGSLETKYHAPDKVTIVAVKDMLFKWINILSKLEKQY